MNNNLIYDLYKTADNPEDWDSLMVEISKVIKSKEESSEINQHLDNATKFIHNEFDLNNKHKTIQQVIDSFPYCVFYLQDNHIKPLNYQASKNQHLIAYFEQLPTREFSYKKITYQGKEYFISYIPEQNIFIASSNKEQMYASELFNQWYLSSKEKEICSLLLLGYSIAEISNLHNRSIYTVRNQVKTILSKSSSPTQQALIAKFYQISILVKNQNNPLPKTHKITLKDGRKLAWCEYGKTDSDNIVVLFHSIHQSRYLHHPDHSILENLNVKVINPDRPSFGKSSFDRNYSTASFADDLKELLDYLNIKKVSLIGVAHGGSFSMKFAEMYSQIVNKVVLVNSLMYVVDDYLNNVGVINKAAFKIAKNSPKVFEKILVTFLPKTLLKDPAVVYKKLYPDATDHDVFNEPALKQMLINDATESNAQGFGKALSYELYTLLNDKHFNPKNILCPVLIYHSDVCNLPNTKSVKKYVKSNLPKAKLSIIDDGRVFILYHLWQEIIKDATTH